MNVFHCNERAKISSVFGYKHEVPLNAPDQYLTVGCSQPAKVAGVHGNMDTFRIQRSGDGRGQALVEKQPHGSCNNRSGCIVPRPARWPASKWVGSGVQLCRREGLARQLRIVFQEVIDVIAILKSSKDGIDR